MVSLGEVGVSGAVRRLPVAEGPGACAAGGGQAHTAERSRSVVGTSPVQVLRPGCGVRRSARAVRAWARSVRMMWRCSWAR
ncbi:hypothetical protein IQ61_44070 [Streptomyces scabiei]|nr:hypothetical protein IQ61_44070 [Streptomyces scabiei]